MNKIQPKTCPDCFRIICKKCGWEANKKDVILIQEAKLTACPICGWRPGDKIV